MGGEVMQQKRKMLSKPQRRFLFWSIVVLLIFAASLIGPHFLVHDPYEANLMNVNKAPNDTYLFGTDYLGRCLACRLVEGASRSIFAAVAIVFITLVFGTMIGILCGYYGGKIDTVVMRFVDAVQAFPSLVFTIAVVAMMGGGLRNCILAMSAVNWTTYCRLSRAQAISLKGKTFVSAAKISGRSNTQILFKTILPNSLTPLVVNASMHIGNTILGFAGLSFLGLGTLPPFPEWGNMLNDGRLTLQIAPWTIIFPGCAIMLVVMIMGMFGDSVNALLNTGDSPVQDNSVN